MKIKCKLDMILSLEVSVYETMWGIRSFTTLLCDDNMEAKAPMKTIYKGNIMELFLAKVRI